MGGAIWAAQELVSPNKSIPGTESCVRLRAGSRGARPVNRHLIVVVVEMSCCQAGGTPWLHRDDALAGVADGHDRLRVFGQAYDGLFGARCSLSVVAALGEL